ncbi:alginate lyase family protein [Adhaeribacter radiodurans]|uniref:Alginate lyase family protein n=1 Tax=Adhaeribacter radiodurans TaxID=2745197 RepID=A0A7L7LE18_9BACT|nr:alginate lyase family protein [Adhaeribacter radiodurans]QMU30997.1 alginate lyase family protein [Adhaeribacter radiodurans]
MRFIYKVCLFGLIATTIPLLFTQAKTKKNPLESSLRVFILKPELLAKTRQEISVNNPAIMPAAKSLRGAADKVVAGPLYSVVNKQFLPPSGDKHDYMSMGTYWWPNPLTPNGLPYVRRDGQANPEIKLLKNDKDLDNMIKGVENTALAYYFFGDEKYAEKAAQLLRTWFLEEDTRMNPNLNFGQAIPGVSHGRGIGIIDTHKFPSLIDDIGLLEESPNWSKADQQGLQDWFSEYLAWLQDNQNGREAAKEKNNHGTWYDVQAASIALFVNKNGVAKNILQAALKKRLATQINPDGRQPFELSRTLSYTYSVMNLNAFFALASLADNVGLDYWHYTTSDGRSIQQALDYLLPFARGEKVWEKEQIKSMESASVYPLLRQAAYEYPEANYGQLAEQLVDKKKMTSKSNLYWPPVQ